MSVISLVFPEPGQLARKVISRSKHRPTFKYPSWKMGRMIHAESHNELHAFRLLDANPDVKAFQEQPLTIRYSLNGEERLHYPDILVTVQAGKEIWEIKPKREAFAEDVVERTAFLSKHLPDLGYTYRMVLGDDLAREPRMRTAQKLVWYGRHPISLTEWESARLLLQKAPTWGCNALGPRTRQILARLFLEGTAYTDIEQTLTDDTVFTATGVNRHG